MSGSDFCCEGFETGTHHFGVVRKQRKGIKVSGERDTPLSQQQQYSRVPTYLLFSVGPTHSIEIVISAILLFFCCCQFLPTKVGNSH